VKTPSRTLSSNVPFPVLSVGLPSLAGAITEQVLSGRSLTLMLQVTNTGDATAENITINQLALRTLGGTGTAILTNPPLPVSLGSLAAGACPDVIIAVNVPSTVTKFSMTENRTVEDESGTSFNYSIAQVVLP
jgi:hypothetical protein